MAAPDTQWNTTQNNPLPAWDPTWGGYGPNPNPNPRPLPEGYKPLPTSPYVDPDEIARIQAYNASVDAARQQQAATPTTTSSTSSRTSSTSTSRPRVSTSLPSSQTVKYQQVNPPAQAPLDPRYRELDELTRQRMIELLNTPQDISPEELMRSPEAAAHRLSSQRAYERNRALVAERNAAQGFSASGAAESDIMRLAQGRGESEAAFMGELAGQKLEANRRRLEQGIQFALSQGQFIEAQRLEERLAQLDAAIRREQIKAALATSNADRSLQRELGLLDVGYRYDALGVGANRDAAMLLANAVG